MLTDLYQLTMMYGYYKTDKMNEEVVFDLFFRKNPFDNGYTVAAGLESLVHYIQELSFTDEDIDYLRSLDLFTDEGFLKDLRHFRFTGEIYAVPEGTIVFPNEPLVRVKARIFEAQLLETALLSLVGHQSLVATKASRIVKAANGKAVLEFGARRAQGPESALLGARAAVIGGCSSTSNVKAGADFDIMLSGTHAHSWIMSFESEYEAFKNYAKVFPDNLILLVDTYDTLRSGLPNAIKVFNEVFQWHGKPKKFGIRLDSGDLAYLSKTARKVLDDAGFHEAMIVASSDLDEYLIKDLEIQGAKIDAYGVGTKLITAYDQPALGCVYKLAAIKENSSWIPKIKRSENPEKIINPGLKRVLRFIDNQKKEAIVDLIVLDNEKVPDQPFEVFHPIYTWKRKTIVDSTCIELLKPIFKNGSLVYELPQMSKITEYVKKQYENFSEEHTRLINPHIYHVDLSEKLWQTKMQLLEATKSK